MRIRLYLDEDAMSRSLARELRARGGNRLGQTQPPDSKLLTADAAELEGCGQATCAARSTGVRAFDGDPNRRLRNIH